MKAIKIGSLIFKPQSYIKILIGLFFLGVSLGIFVASKSFKIVLFIPMIIGIFLMILGFKEAQQEDQS